MHYNFTISTGGFGYSNSALNLLFICKQIYAEARLIPSSLNKCCGSHSRLEEVAEKLLTKEQKEAMLSKVGGSIYRVRD